MYSILISGTERTTYLESTSQNYNKTHLTKNQTPVFHKFKEQYDTEKISLN